jgi:hypothetical protein
MIATILWLREKSILLPMQLTVKKLVCMVVPTSFSITIVMNASSSMDLETICLLLAGIHTKNLW